MNNQPLFPQGSLSEQKNKGRARVKVAVFVVLAIHGIGLLALLMQGCKREQEAQPPTADQSTNTNATPAFVEPTNQPPAATAGVTNPASQQVETPAAPGTPSTPAVPPAAATEYKIVSGDTLSKIATKFHVPLKALIDANPGVDPLKLKIGQTIHVPPAAATAQGSASSASPASPGDTTAASEHLYTVKSGDTLSKIAAEHKVTIKALRSANNLTTDRITVGQKLKIPSKSSAPATTTTAATDTSAAPVSSSAAVTR